MSKHFTRTEAIAEAKTLFGADWKNAAKIEHDGAFWCVSEQLYQITQEGRATGPKYPLAVALELLDFKSKYDAGFQVYELKKAA